MRVILTTISIISPNLSLFLRLWPWRRWMDRLVLMWQNLRLPCFVVVSFYTWTLRADIGNQILRVDRDASPSPARSCHTARRWYSILFYFELFCFVCLCSVLIYLFWFVFCCLFSFYSVLAYLFCFFLFVCLFVCSSLSYLFSLKLIFFVLNSLPFYCSLVFSIILIYSIPFVFFLFIYFIYLILNFIYSILFWILFYYFSLHFSLFCAPFFIYFVSGLYLPYFRLIFFPLLQSLF